MFNAVQRVSLNWLEILGSERSILISIKYGFPFYKMDNEKLLNKVAVVVPVYKNIPDKNELQYLNHNLRTLKNYPVILVAPKGLELDNYPLSKIFNVEYFNSEYFESIVGYNRLLMSESFYHRFEKYQYILICQTDALVFKDDLLNWCKKSYDYVGAPWIGRPFFLFQYVFAKLGPLAALQLVFKNNLFNAVGNGGLSLRKVNSFIHALEQEKNVTRWKINEDFYWSFFAKINGQPLLKPKTKEAALFSIETDPVRTMENQNNQLPMGIHAWERYNPIFWKKHIEIILKLGNE